jgi:hypothetical protein
MRVSVRYARHAVNTPCRIVEHCRVDHVANMLYSSPRAMLGRPEF